MAGFQKAKAEQAALKIGVYGPAGSGKTFTALLIAEGLARHTGRRVAYVDTERGTDFYVKPVPARTTHPDAFDIDALYTRSLAEVLEAVRGLRTQDHGVVVIDSITHLWEAAIAAYRGKRTRAGTIPMQAWAGIKRPYKELMHLLINSPLHVLILGRQANEWGDDEEGELVQTGYKMRAEGETAYEPHVLIRMEAVRPREGKKVLKHAVAVPTAFVEKDRSGVLSGRLIEWPSFDTVAAPLLGLLGGTQARIEGEEETAERDAVALEEQQLAAARARLLAAPSLADLRAVWDRLSTDQQTALEADKDRRKRELTGAAPVATPVDELFELIERVASLEQARTEDVLQRLFRGLKTQAACLDDLSPAELKTALSVVRRKLGELESASPAASTLPGMEQQPGSGSDLDALRH